MNRGVLIGFALLAAVVAAYEFSQRSDPHIEGHTYVEQRDLLGISHTRDLGIFHLKAGIKTQALEGVVINSAFFYLPVNRNRIHDSLQGAMFQMEDSLGNVYSCLLLTEKTKISIAQQISANGESITLEYVTGAPPVGERRKLDVVFIEGRRISVFELIDRFYEGDIEAVEEQFIRIHAVTLSPDVGGA